MGQRQAFTRLLDNGWGSTTMSSTAIAVLALLAADTGGREQLACSVQPATSSPGKLLSLGLL